jgi:hypothetical protein
VSIQAIAWAIEQQEVTEPSTRWVLVCLANYAGTDGRCAFPSIARLMRDSGFSERAVQTHLRKLAEVPLIRRGNQAYATSHIKRGDRIPVVYDLLMPRGARAAPRSVDGVQLALHGVHLATSRGAPGAPNPDLIREEPKNAQKAPRTFEQDFQERFGFAPVEAVTVTPRRRSRS